MPGIEALVVDRDQPRILQPRHASGLELETGQELLIAGVAGIHHLQRDRAVQPGVEAAIDRRHAAGGDLGRNAIAPVEQCALEVVARRCSHALIVGGGRPCARNLYAACLNKRCGPPYTTSVSRIPVGDDVLDPDEPTYDLRSVADLLGVAVTKVQQHLKEGHLVAVRRAGDVVVPQIFFTSTGEVVKSLPGLLVVLRDGGYQDTEIVRWLFTPDPSLTVTRDGSREALSNARPVDALHAHQAREVLRRAQAMAY